MKNADASTKGDVGALLPAVALVAVLAACGDGGKAGESRGGGPGGGPGGSKGPVPVVTVEATLREATDAVEALGTARAAESVDLSAKVTNTVTAIRFREGARVARGTVLVELDSAQLRAELAAAQGGESMVPAATPVTTARTPAPRWQR